MKQLLYKNKKGFLLYILGALITALTGVLSSLALAIGFSIFEATSQQERRSRAILTVILGLSPVLLQVLSRYMRMGFMRDVLIDVRQLAYQKIMKTPIEQFRQKKGEDYVALLVNDINVFERDFFLAILNVVYSYGSFLIGMVILFAISPIISLLVLIGSIVIFIISKLYEKPIRNNVKRKQEGNAQYNEQISNVLGGLEVIKLYQVEDHFRGPFYSIVGRLEMIKRKSNQLEISQHTIIEWFASTFQIAMLVFTTFLYMEGDISLLSMILVYTFLGNMIWANVNGSSMINRLKGSIDIFNRITSEPEWEQGKETYDLNNEIRVKDLDFNYGEKYVLKSLNLDISKGDKVLIYGPSGTGKTTLINCLSQNLTSYDGEINVDNKELKTIDFESLLEHCSYIRQHHFMFEASIKDNIVLGEVFDEEKLNDILESVDLKEWIDSLKDGSHHLLSANGSNISGGQRQRISIARELYKDNEVLFVDEPSASLDDETARILYNTLLSLDKTLIIVSHRHLNYLGERVDQVINMEELSYE